MGFTGKLNLFSKFPILIPSQYAVCGSHNIEFSYVELVFLSKYSYDFPEHALLYIARMNHGWKEGRGDILLAFSQAFPNAFK